VLKPKGNCLLGTPNHRWNRSIKLGVNQVGLMSMDKLVLT